MSTSHDAWHALENMFTSSSHARVMQILMQLATFQKKDMNIFNYFRKIKHFADTLSAIGKPLEDEELIAYLLRGLRSEYDALVTSITTRADSYTVSDIYAHMFSFEMHLEQNNTKVQISANNVNKSFGRGGGRNSRGCRCGRDGGHATGTRGGYSSQGGHNNSGGHIDV
ncbi:uncharacterized protein LOC133927695 [Phragmites australis]|uniref:uncharacterized protein LOC133927695 n=1 Tax=Phragmites australis TaxID=29695 RepID=UPI002D776B9A|nr:uncharacterized protein LOC133927695 [Phragmites australis]